jgi:carbon monoxide dehydrogenase subunit G
LKAEAVNELMINRPPDEVFDFFSDHENDKLWRPGVIEMRKLSGDGVGARYAQSVKGPGGRSIRAGIEVTEFDKPRRLAFRTVEGPVRPTGSYSLEQTGEGTRVRFELSAKLGGLKRLMKGPVEKTMRSEVAQLESAKQVLESSRS